ncbi:hypothetical protein CCHR01_15388 [Colletotrichum chrysophilum]|uniref:Uncharacterized protein n=1 Tax=Colletotrichum chrysophilum TaxID=1836956 RepID=A0AAD9A6A9_9PEZI|nr:hypothetical protein CCHR01_15388 [Colletotrichum chrysophilum]
MAFSVGDWFVLSERRVDFGNRRRRFCAWEGAEREAKNLRQCISVDENDFFLTFGVDGLLLGHELIT